VVEVLLVGGPVGGPIVTLGEFITEGVDGTSQFTWVLAVFELPDASIVGVKQVIVLVFKAADTSGVEVFELIITGIALWQPFTTSCTTKVQVPGVIVLVQDCAEKAELGNGRNDGVPGDNIAKLTGPGETTLLIHNVL
jgi:hypothetical protein